MAPPSGGGLRARIPPLLPSSGGPGALAFPGGGVMGHVEVRKGRQLVFTGNLARRLRKEARQQHRAPAKIVEVAIRAALRARKGARRP